MHVSAKPINKFVACASQAGKLGNTMDGFDNGSRNTQSRKPIRLTQGIILLLRIMRVYSYA